MLMCGIWLGVLWDLYVYLGVMLGVLVLMMSVLSGNLVVSW